MQGRYPSGMLVVFSNCTDPANEDVFNRRYNAHVPEFVETGWVSNGLRYKAPENRPPSQISNYLATYDTERWDMEDMLDSIRDIHSPDWQKRNTDIPFIKGEGSNVFRRCGPPNRPEVGGFTTVKTGTAAITGLIVMYGTFADPNKENEYNIWYNRQFVPQALKVSPFHTAYRYACTVRESDHTRVFLTMYETDVKDPVGATAEFIQDWKTKTPQSPLVKELGYDIFTPIFEFIPQTAQP